MISNERKKDLEKQGYRIVGNHSLIKVCLWCKKSLKDEDTCYKNKFYSIRSWRCIQMTPIVDFCSLSCMWCWRDIQVKNKRIKKFNSPKSIIDNCIKEQREILQGFLGNKKTNLKKFKEALNPIHFAISLSSEPTFYPKLPELINELHSRSITSFLVTNGTNPLMLKKLIKNQPTQIYITLPAPNKEIFTKFCKPKEKDAWEKIMDSLLLLKKFKRSTIRLTLVKNLNMCNELEYSKLIKKASPQFLEIKAYMCVGYSRYRLDYKDMPSHSEIKEFSKKIASLTNLKIIDEKPESRVVLLMKEDKNRKLDFD